LQKGANTVQAYSYASAYAIQTTPIANDEDGIEITNFIAENPSVGETSWASSAMLFDTPEEALAKLITLKLPRERRNDGVTYPRVVRVELKCDITSANDELYEALLK
jgi:hypothetical protein